MRSSFPLSASPSSDFTDVLRICAVAAGYFLAAKASLAFAIPPGYATAVWPPAGIALAASLVYGTRIWPGVWLGAALANFTVGQSLPLACAIATGNTLEAVCAAWLARRLIGAPFEFTHPGQVVRFAAIAALGAIVSATPAVTVLFAAGDIAPEHLLENWYTWWQGDTTGIIVIAPLLLAWLRDDGTAGVPRRLELALFAVLLAAAFAAVYLLAARYDPGVGGALTFLLVPFMAWAGCRFGERVVTTTIAVVALAATWGTANRYGPFVFTSLNDSLLILQAFAGTVALVGLALCALTRQREEARAALERSRDNLDLIVRDRSDAMRYYAKSMRALSQRIVQAQDIDKKRIAAELHDELGTNLAAIEFNLRLLQKQLALGPGGEPQRCLDDSLALLERAAHAAREVTEQLRPADLGKGGLATALRRAAAELEARTGIPSRVRCEGAADGFAPAVEAAAYRIAQEALRNAASHARAGSVEIALRCSAGSILIAVRDDGIGFEPSAVESGTHPSGWGLLIMQERAEAAGGKLRIHSAPGQGTTVTAEFPA